MEVARSVRGPAAPPRLHTPGPGDAGPGSRWLINGYPATIVTWTAGEWGRLAERPADAQPHGNGTWCALRID